MKKYFDHITQKPTHERRGHALRWALGIIAVIAVGWLVMLPLRFANLVAQSGQSNDAGSQTASVAQGSGNATLLVATSTDSQ
jgi:hypothetical protein